MTKKPTDKSMLLAPTLLAALLCGTAPLSLGADFPERIASERRSAEVGLGVDRLPLLKRRAGPGAEKTAALLMERLHGRQSSLYTSDRHKREVTKDKVSLVSDQGWYLNVYADGTSVRYRNYGYLERRGDKLARPLAERFNQQELEKMGRDFIAQNLDGLVKLRKNEDLMPYFSEFEVTGGGPARKRGKMDPEMVHASTVVFTRTINGLPVLGGGSKIAVIFANNGEPVGFDYDWPRYSQTRASQQILPVAQIRGRTAQYSGLQSDDAGVQELHFECGYVDLGARKRDPRALVQGGCMRHAAKRSVIDTKAHAANQGAGHVLVASLDFLPAGKKVERDAVWERALGAGNEDPGAIKE